MTAKKEKGKSKRITFKCKFCEKSKSLTTMVVITTYFPPVVACHDCAAKIS